VCGSYLGGAVILQAINKSLDQFNKNLFSSGVFTYLELKNAKKWAGGAQCC